MSELETFFNFARETMHEAGRLTLEYYGRGVDIIEKSDGSPVTIADREAESFIRRAIESRFPDHGIYGEEHGVKEPAGGCSYTWYIDPIDGTKSFIHGVPLYSGLLALARGDETVVGVIELPALGEQVSAAGGLGCWQNERRVHVSKVDDLSRSLLLCSDPRDLERDASVPGWRHLWEKCRYVRSWGDAYGYAMVATGRAEIMIDPRAQPYDYAPLPVILREAGGSFTDWKGNPTIRGVSGVAVNGALRDEVLRHLAG